MPVPEVDAPPVLDADALALLRRAARASMAAEREDCEPDEEDDVEAEHAALLAWLAALRPGEPLPPMPAAPDFATLLEWSENDGLEPLALWCDAAIEARRARAKAERERRREAEARERAERAREAAEFEEERARLRGDIADTKRRLAALEAKLRGRAPQGHLERQVIAAAVADRDCKAALALPRRSRPAEDIK